MIKFDDIDKEIIRQKINFPEKLDQEIYESLKISAKEYRARTSTHDFKKLLREATKSFDDQVADLKLTALKELKTLMVSNDKKIAIDAIRAILAVNNNITREDKKAMSIFEKKLARNVGLM